MLVVAHHTVLDPSFWQLAAEQPIPSHLRLHHVLPSKDGSTGVCLWEAESAEAVAAFVEPVLRHLSRNEYFPVHEQNARVLSLAGIVQANALAEWRRSGMMERPTLPPELPADASPSVAAPAP